MTKKLDIAVNSVVGELGYTLTTQPAAPIASAPISNWPQNDHGNPSSSR